MKDPLENLPGADRLPAGAPFQCPPSPTCPPAAPSQEAVEEICSIFKQEHADLSQELTTLKEESFCVQKGNFLLLIFDIWSCVLKQKLFSSLLPPLRILKMRHFQTLTFTQAISIIQYN